jgi:hypothetical protein
VANPIGRVSESNTLCNGASDSESLSESGSQRIGFTDHVTAGKTGRQRNLESGSHTKRKIDSKPARSVKLTIEHVAILYKRIAAAKPVGLPIVSLYICFAISRASLATSSSLPWVESLEVVATFSYHSYVIF